MNVRDTDLYFEILGRLKRAHIPPHVMSAIQNMSKQTVIELFRDCFDTSDVLERYEDFEEIY